MLLRPEIAALRVDDTPQRQAQARLIAEMDRWRASPVAAPVLADIAKFAAGADLAECADLAALFAKGGRAGRDFADAFIAAMTAALAQVPLGYVAARHFTNGITSTLLLGQSGDVTLALVALGNGSGEPDSITLSPVECWEHILAGGAAVRVIACQPVGPDQAKLEATHHHIGAGDTIARDGRMQALVYGKVDGCMVSLRLQRRLADAGPVREYDLATGQLVHRAAGTQMESRRALMVNLLGRMRRREAAPMLALIAQEAGPDALRWQALRECLGLDTATGFAALCTIAGAGEDPLAGAAGALRAQLVEAYPQLAAHMSGALA